MPNPVIIKAKDKDGIEQTLSMTAWAIHEGMAKSHFGRMFRDCKDCGMTDQEAVDEIRNPTDRKQGRVRGKNSSGSAIANEERKFQELKPWWDMFNFRPQVEI